MGTRDYTNGWEIYSLADPTTQEVRYVGVSRDAEERFSFHITFCCKRDTPVRRWVDDLLEQSLKPTMQILQRGKGTSYYRVEKAWISKFKEAGANLLNIFGVQSQSKGFTSTSSETKTKLSKAGKEAWKYRKMDPAHLRRMVEGRQRYLANKKAR